MAEENVRPPCMQRRIMRDIQQIAQMESDYILIDAENTKLIKCVITGPPFGPFEGGLFEVCLGLEDFPARPPHVKFDTPVFHPNICPYEGRVCMNILDRDEWGAATRLNQVLEAARSLLNQPNTQSPLNGSAAAMLRLNERMYSETVKVWTHVFAGADESTAPEYLMKLVKYVAETLNIARSKALRKLTQKEWDITQICRPSSGHSLSPP